MEAAADVLAHQQVPDSPSALVHGDFWQGNSMWVDDETVGLIDWDMAGVGNAGIDLGSARLDAAIMFGQEAVAHVLSGWERASGMRAENVPYWDVVAALSTPADMDTWRPQIHAQGRTDLASATMNARRDTFLQSAADQF